jgi:virginiamycin A acetyltransferase
MLLETSTFDSALNMKKRLRRIIKRTIQGLSLVFVFPGALLCAFGQIKVFYIFFAQLFALFPGIVGTFLRSAFYKFTLRECSIDTAISFGTFFSSRDARVGENVSIGSFCVIGRARIGKGTQISSHVEIPSGRYQHPRDEQGRFLDSEIGEVVIGSDCWIGASAVIMANVGDQSTIGAGSVVVTEIPDHVIAVGVPAKPIKNSLDS